MSMRVKFETLVHDLGRDDLEVLRRTVASEIDGRRRKTAIQIEDIHPEMSPAAKDEAAREIARVLAEER
jgi:hypothetical protein